MPDYPAISVLYVDDEPDLLEIGRLFLERKGLFSVDTVESAPEALRVLSEKRYDAIISDYQMPEMDGIGLLKRVRASGNTVPFIIFTGRGREEIVIQALNEGADFYLQKGGEPVSQFTELAHKVQTAVQQRRAEESIRDHERREADIINFLPDATFAIDRTGHVITWNHAIEEMTGVSAMEILGKGEYEYAIPFYGQRQPILIDLISESDEAIAKKYSHIIHEKDVLIAETTLPRPKGNPVILMGKASPLYNRQGGIIGAIESIRDITRIRQAEVSLRESEQKYRTVFETTGTATVMIEDDATISLVNSEFERLSGYRKDEIEYHKKWTDFVVSEDLDRMLTQHRLRRQDRLSALSHYEFRFVQRSNAIRDIYLTIDVIPGTGKSVASLLDITTRNQAESELRAAYEQLTATEEELRRQYRDLAEKEQKLRQSEERYRNVVEDQTEFISRFLPDGTHVFVNEAYCRYFHLKRDEILGHRFRPKIPAEDRERVTQFFASLTSENPVDSIEHRIMMPDGSVRWQRWSDRAIFDPSGMVIEYQSVGRDITDENATREALQQSEERFRKIFENSPLGMALSTPDFRFISVNPAMVSITGYTREELLQLSFKDITHPDHLGGDVEHIRELAEDQIPVYTTEKRYIRKDGNIIWGLLKVTTIRDQQGVLRYFAAQIEDITGRKKAGAALRESEERYRHLVEESPDAIIVHTSGRIVYANPACIRLLGAKDSRDLVGRPVLNFVHPDFQRTVLERVRIMTEKREPVSLLEEKFLRLDGTAIDVDVAAIPIVFENEPSVQVTFRDITGRKQWEVSLQKSEEKYRLTLDATNDGIWEWDIPTGGAFFSPRCYSMLGYEPGEFPATYAAWHSLLHPEDLVPTEQKIQDHLGKKDGSYTTEFRMRTKQGAWKWILARGKVVKRDAAGNPLQMVGTHTDIDDRKRFEEALCESEERLSTIIGESPISIQVMSPNGRTLQVNHAFELLWGATLEDLKDYNMLEDKQLVQLGIMPVIQRGFSGETLTIPPVQYDTRRILGFGERKWVQGRIYPVRDTGGSIRNVILMHEDITDRKRSEDALRQANKKLTLLTSITRHDINNQITTLLGLLHILERKHSDPTLIEYFHKISTSTKRISSMIRFTKEYERIGVHEPVWQEIHSIVRTAAQDSPTGKVIINNDIPSGTEVYADPMIVRVFYNLMDNAIRYGGTITAIRFTVQESGDDTIIVCEDDGEGIPAGEKERIFDHGFGKNTGMGLFLAREILSITGITIRETGESGKGGRFEITVPKGAYRVTDIQQKIIP